MKLLEENDPFLKIATPEFDLINMPDDYTETVDEMFDLMYAVGAVGLAAPQVGLPWRMFVIDPGNGPITCINPKIMDIDESKQLLGDNKDFEDVDIDEVFNSNIVSFKEGCLSFPGLLLEVKRPSQILVKYYDIKLRPVYKLLTGFEAIVFSHELDHLNGKLFTDRVSNLQLKRALKKRKKQTS